MKPYGWDSIRIEYVAAGLEAMDTAYLGRDLDLNLSPLFLFTFEDGSGVPREILQFVDGRIAAAARYCGGGCRYS